MARLKKCPICKEERHVLYSRHGKVYTEEGNKAMKATDYRICQTCDTIFDKDDNTHYQASIIIKNAHDKAIITTENTITSKIDRFFENPMYL